MLHTSKKGFTSSFSPKNRDITGKIHESHYYTLYIYIHQGGARNYIHRVQHPKGNRLAGGGFKSSSSSSSSSRSGRCKNPKPGASLARFHVNHVRPEARVRPAPSFTPDLSPVLTLSLREERERDEKADGGRGSRPSAIKHPKHIFSGFVTSLGGRQRRPGAPVPTSVVILLVSRGDGEGGICSTGVHGPHTRQRSRFWTPWSAPFSLLLPDNLWFTWLTLAPQGDVLFCSLFSRDIKRESVSSTGLILIDRNTSQDLVEICVRI